MRLSARRPAAAGGSADGLDARPLFLLPLRVDHDLVLHRPLALVFLIDFTELSGRTTGLPGFTYGTALAISALRMPMIMLQTVPFVGLFSAMATLVSLNRKYELVIARSAGVSAWQFLLPCCIGALLFGVLSVGVLNPIAAHAFSWSEQMETQLRSGKSNTVSAVRRALDPAENQLRRHHHRRPRHPQPGPGDGRRRLFHPRPARQHRRTQGRGARLSARRLLGTCRTSRRFETAPSDGSETDRVRDQSQAGIRAGTAGAPRNHPFLRPARKDRGCPLLRPQGKCLCHAVRFAGGVAVPARRHDADCGNSFNAICAGWGSRQR